MHFFYVILGWCFVMYGILQSVMGMILDYNIELF